MRVVVCTGIAGSQRRDCLREVAAYARQFNKELEIIDVFEVLREVSQGPIDEATVLNLPPNELLRLTNTTYKEIASRLKRLRTERQEDEDVAVAVVARATFRVPGQILKEASRRTVRTLNPDLYISIVHNLPDLKRNLDNDSSGRFQNITLLDILLWRKEETEETRKWGNPHYIVARNEPPSTIFDLIFRPEAKKFYASFPISHSHQRDVLRAKKLIAKLRQRNYTLFDPLAIEDMDYIKELQSQRRERGRGALANYSQEDINALLREAGAQTVLRDYALIDQSDGVIVRYAGQRYQRYVEEKGQVIPDIHVPLSAGVVCEMVHGHYKGKRVYAVWLVKDTLPSPFFEYHSLRVFQSEKELLTYLARSHW